jgi:hypothetical protein
MFLAVKEVILQLHGVHSFCLNTEKAFQEELARCHICGTSASNTQVALGKTWLAFRKHPQKIFLYLFYIFYIYVSYFYILPYHTPNVFISSFLFTLLLSFSFFFALVVLLTYLPECGDYRFVSPLGLQLCLLLFVTVLPSVTQSPSV